MRAVVKAVTACPQLREIDFTNTGLGERVKDLLDAWSNRTDIEKVCLGFNKLGTSFASRWGEFVSRQTNLKYVDLRYISVGPKIRSVRSVVINHSSAKHSHHELLFLLLFRLSNLYQRTVMRLYKSWFWTAILWRRSPLRHWWKC